MIAAMIAAVRPGAALEAPDVVAEFDTRNQPRLDQIGKVAIDGGAVVSQRNQRGGELGVADRRSCALQVLEHHQAWHGSAQAAAANQGSPRLDRPGRDRSW